MKRRLPFLVLAAVLPLLSQRTGGDERSLTCDDSGRRRDDDRDRFCEMREYNLANAPRVSVDGRANGGISIKGWNRSDVLVRAKVETWAPAGGEARSMASQVHVLTSGGDIRADGAEFGRDRGWAVSYELFVPHTTNLRLKANNGGIAISDVMGDINFEAVNGGVSLRRLGGSVRGKTVNGGLQVELSGARWEGNEMNVATVNGGVSLAVPAQYSARLETATVNGRISVDFPITVQGNIDRELSFTLGGGGPLIRATTTNGGVSVKRRS